jgi:hypothetical protein
MSDRAGRQTMAQPGNSSGLLLNAAKAAPLDAELQKFHEGPKCGQCVHYRQYPPNRDAHGAIDMSQPTVGQCRYELRAAPIVIITPQGPQFQGMFSAYQQIEPDFDACGRGFKAREEKP